MGATEEYLDNVDVTEVMSLHKIDHYKHRDVLKELLVRRKYSVFNLSQDHRILLIHIVYFSEVFQEVISSFAMNLPSLLRKNTIPIILHSESTDVIKKFQKTSDVPHIKDVLFVQIDHDMIRKLDMYDEHIPDQMIGAFQNFGIKVNKLNIFQKRKCTFGMMIIEDGQMVKRIVYQPGTRVEFCGMWYLDLNIKRVEGQSEKAYFHSLLQVFPHFAPDELMQIVLKITRVFSEEEKKSQADDFNMSIVSSTRRFFFKKFAMTEFSCEPFYMYEECLQYKGVYNLESKIKKAERIAQIFLGDKKSSPLLQVNTNQKNIDFVLDIIEKAKKYQEFPYHDLFDAVTSDLRGTVLIDIYLRFKQSDLYKEMNEAIQKRRESCVNIVVSFNPKRNDVLDFE